MKWQQIGKKRHIGTQMVPKSPRIATLTPEITSGCYLLVHKIKWHQNVLMGHIAVQMEQQSPKQITSAS
jgi:hypothetical protein